jgi:hypothetical protein
MKALAMSLGALLLPAVSASAHHSFAAVFDAAKPVTLAGVVTKVEWVNPHVFFHIDVTAVDGSLASWTIENSASNMLVRQGWTRNSLKVGDIVTIQGCLARDGSKLAIARSVVLETGKRLFESPAGSCPER